MKESKTKSNVKNTNGKKRQALPPPPIKKEILEEKINGQEVERIIKGCIYSIVNDNGEIETGECVDYNRVTGRVTLKKLKP